MITFVEEAAQGKYRVESVSQCGDNYRDLLVKVEYTDKREAAMNFSAWCHMFFPHYGIVTNAETGAVEYTFGSEYFFKEAKMS